MSDWWMGFLCGAIISGFFGGILCYVAGYDAALRYVKRSDWR